MARDRQRAKQRRAKRERTPPGPGGSAAGSASARARDIGLDQADVDDAGLGHTPPPEPTEHAFPDVEEARMAEARPDRADDELEGDRDLVPTRDVDPAVAEERAAARRSRKKRGRFITFLGHCVDELRRVQWPDRRHVAQGTAVTLGFVVLAGGYLGLLDALWKPLIEAIL